MWLDQLPHCAPTVHPDTMEKVVRVESRGNPLALNVNGLPDNQQPRPQTTSEAIRLAKFWIDRGYRVDIGISQITDRNLPDLHVTIEQILGDDTQAICMNLGAGGRILTDDYGRAVQRYGEGQAALAAALSAYNTGDFVRGLHNGYVAKYYTVPAIEGMQVSPRTHVVRAAIRRHAADIDVWQ